MVRFRLLWSVIALFAAVSALPQQTRGSEEHPWFKRTPESDIPVLKKILEYRSQKDWVRAIDAASSTMGPTGVDDFLLETLSDTYFERAQDDTPNRMRWVKDAVKYSERALKTNPADPINIFNLGEAYLTAGMNADRKADACVYYQNSLHVFEGLKEHPTLKDEWGTIEGERVRIAPYRQSLENKIKQVRGLAAECH